MTPHSIPTADLVARIERIKTLMGRHAQSSVQWNAGRTALGPLLSEMQRRQKANHGEADWHKWGAPAIPPSGESAV